MQPSLRISTYLVLIPYLSVCSVVAAGEPAKPNATSAVTGRIVIEAYGDATVILYTQDGGKIVVGKNSQVEIELPSSTKSAPQQFTSKSASSGNETGATRSRSTRDRTYG